MECIFCMNVSHHFKVLITCYLQNDFDEYRHVCERCKIQVQAYHEGKKLTIRNILWRLTRYLNVR